MHGTARCEASAHAVITVFEDSESNNDIMTEGYTSRVILQFLLQAAHEESDGGAARGLTARRQGWDGRGTPAGAERAKDEQPDRLPRKWALGNSADSDSP